MGEQKEKKYKTKILLTPVKFVFLTKYAVSVTMSADSKTKKEQKIMSGNGWLGFIHTQTLKNSVLPI